MKATRALFWYCTVLAIFFTFHLNISFARQLSASQIVQLYGLKSNAEGGYSKQTYSLCASARCRKTGLPDSNAILYLLKGSDKSLFHRLPYDEMYHFYLGQPVNCVLLYPDGAIKVIKLGSHILNNQYVQFLVPKNVWQGLFINSHHGFALLGTAMTPGFVAKDRKFGQRCRLLKQYPAAKQYINFLTKEA